MKRYSNPVHGVYKIGTKKGRCDGETGPDIVTQPSRGYHSTTEGTPSGHVRSGRKGGVGTNHSNICGRFPHNEEDSSLRVSFGASLDYQIAVVSCSISSGERPSEKAQTT